MDRPALFLSYNSGDRPAVVAVQKLLAARGITTFLDRDQLLPGLPWPAALEEGLRGTGAVAVFIGRELGGWQKREMWFALDRQVREEKHGHPFPVIPVLLPGADPTASFLLANTWIDLRGGVDSAAVAEPLEAFEHAINASACVPLAPEERAAALRPYRGLEPFREEHSAFFAGRASFASELFKFTVGKELVAVVGPSGSGKSSVVQAGLVPILRRQFPPATTWDVVTFTPGSDPFHRLASALAPLLEHDKSETDRLTEAKKLGDRLADDEVRLESVIDRVIGKSNGTGRLLVVADQFEELFTLTPEPNHRPFARALVRALGKARFTLLVTLRADFYSQIITLDRELSDRLAPAQVNIGALTRDELKESIIKPAKLVGLEFEPGLVDRILHDVGSEPGNLPLLEFALTGLWTKRQNRTLTNAAYDEIGGVTGALAQRAEAVFAQFAPEEQTAARRLLSRLVRVARPEEGAEDTRQRIELQPADPVAEKVALALAGPEVRLLVMGRPEGEEHSGAQTVEVAHEALIRNWGRLRTWLNEDREFLLWRQRLQIQVEQWEEHGRDSSYLLRGVSLSEAERWLIGRRQDVMATQQRFIEEGTALRKQEHEEEERRRQAEIQNANRMKEAAEARAVAEVRRARVLRFSSLALGALLLLALGAVVFALWQRAVARARELVSASVASLDTDPEISVLIAPRAVASTWPWARSVLPEAERQLHRAILASHINVTLSGHSGGTTSVAWSRDGKRLATASTDKTAKIWDAGTGKLLITLVGHKGYLSSVAWRPDGDRLATTSFDGTAKIWDAGTGRELLTLTRHDSERDFVEPGDQALPIIHFSKVLSPPVSHKLSSAAWSPDGRRLATASEDKTAQVWDAETGRELLTLSGHSFEVMSVAWSLNGKRLATASSDNTAKVWDADTGKELLTLSGHSDEVLSVAWSPDGEYLATASGDKTARVWDAHTGKTLLTLNGHSDSVHSVAWSPDGEELATASDDRTVKVWGAQTGEQVKRKEVLTLNGHTDSVLCIAWSPDGKRLATASLDRTAKVWDRETGELLTLSGDHLAWSPDSKWLATVSGNNTKLLNAETGTELLALNSGEMISCVAWSPDGKRLATASFNKTAKVWDAQTGKPLVTLSGLSLNDSVVAWSPDGRRLATASGDEAAKVWDAETGKGLLTLSGHNEAVYDVAWSPDGKRLATASVDKTAKIWDAGTGKVLQTLTGHIGDLSAVAWSPDGTRLATASGDKRQGEDMTAKVWEARNGKEVLTLSGHSGYLSGVAWSPDGKRLATASLDGTAKVWDARTGKELLTLSGQHGDLSGVAWSPDGKRLATASSERVQVYAMDIQDLMALARKRVTAHPSQEGCRKYLNGDNCPPIP